MKRSNTPSILEGSGPKKAMQILNLAALTDTLGFRDEAISLLNRAYAAFDNAILPQTPADAVATGVEN